MKPANCFYSSGVTVMTQERWDLQQWTMAQLQRTAQDTAQLRCDVVIRKDGSLGDDPIGPWGIVVVERVQVQEMNPSPKHGAAYLLREPFVLEPRVFVIGGRAYGVLYGHTATARSGNGPMFYAMPDGSCSWRGCQYDPALMYDHDRCVRTLLQNPFGGRERLPAEEATIFFVRDTILHHLPELLSRSEHLARTLGTGFLRVDYFIEGTRVLLNEVTFGSALLFPGHSRRVYAILLAGRALNNQDVAGFQEGAVTGRSPL